MMAENANLKLIKGVTFDWVSGQYKKILPHVADKAVYVIARGSLEKLSPLFGTFRGKAAIKRWYAKNQQIPLKGGINPFCLVGDLGKFIVVEDQVISYGTMSKTKTEPSCDWVSIWTLKRGKIMRCWLVMDTATAFLKLQKADPKALLK